MKSLTALPDLTAFEGTPGVGTYQWMVAENRVTWSADLCRIFGLENAPTDDRGFLAFVHPDDRTRVEAETSAFLEAGTSYSHAFRIIRPDGKVRLIHDRGTIARNPDGSAILLRGVNIDITQDAPSGGAPTHNDADLEGERLRRVAKAAGFGLYDFDLRTGRAVWSGEALRIIGRKDAVGFDSMEMALMQVHPDDRTRVREEMAAATLGRGSYDLEYRIVKPGGEVRWLRDRGTTFGPPDAQTGVTSRATGLLNDVTDRKAAEQVLADNAEHLRRILDSNVGFVGILKPDGTVLEANATALQAGGLRREDVIGQKFWDAYWWNHDDATAERLKAAVQTARSGESVRYDAVVRMLGGRMITIDFLLSPVFDGDGNVTYLVPSGFDISERKQALDDLRNSEERFRLLLEQAPDGIIVADASGRITAVNSAAEALLGYAREEILSMPFVELLTPDEPSELLDGLAQQPPSEVTRGEWQIRRRDGTTFDAEIVARALPSGGFQAIMRDVTDQRAAEKQLQLLINEVQENAALLEAVFRAIPGVIYAKDRQGRLTNANVDTLALIGKPWAECRNKTDAEFLDNAEQAAQIMANDQKIMESGLTEELEETVGHDAYGPRVFLSRKSPFRDASGTVIGLVGASLDITERKRNEERRKLLMGEMRHRVKNLFAVVESIVRLSCRGAEDPQQAAAAITGRLQAFARAHALVEGADKADVQAEGGLAQLVKVTLAPHQQVPEQVAIVGPDVSLSGPAATAIALILHEFATNAVKYGALSDPAGRLHVAWEIGDGILSLVWTETAGPPITDRPTRSGFGSLLADACARNDLGGTIEYDWRAEGLVATLQVQAKLLSPRTASDT